MKWPKISLESVCTNVFSGGTPSTTNPQYYDGNIPWLRTQEVIFNRISDTEIKITDVGLANSNAKWIPENSVIVAMYGNSAGRVAINLIPLTTNQACCNLIINPEIADYRYVFYALTNYYEVLKGLSSGAAQNNLNAGQVKTFEIPKPPLQIQQKISELLSAYDDLIENNRRRIQLLEESARLLYREWFVHLRFPGHEHVKVKDGVPDGWERTTIDSVAETVGGGTPSTKVNEYWDDGNITWFTPTDLTKNDCLVLLDSERKITEVGFKSSSARILPPETILMSSRASIGYFGIYEFEACTNQGFISLISKYKNIKMYLMFNLIYRVDEIIGLAGGTTYKEINKTTFRAMQILKPSSSLLAQFEDYSYSIIKEIRCLKKQICKLAEARDLLLPRLMNGEIEV